MISRRFALKTPLALLGLVSSLSAIDFKERYPKAWKVDSINQSAVILYGQKKFATLQKSDRIDIILPSGVIEDRNNITVGIESTLEAKSVALFQDANPQSLVAVFEINEQMILSYEVTIRMLFKGTIFAVIEDVNGQLYYARKYVDIVTLSCMA